MHFASASQRGRPMPSAGPISRARLSADRVGYPDRGGHRRLWHVQEIGDVRLVAEATLDELSGEQCALDEAEIAARRVFGDLGLEGVAVVEVRDERANHLDAFGHANRLEAPAAIDQPVATCLVRVTANEYGHGLTVGLDRGPEIGDVSGIKAISQPVVDDVGRIEFPDLVAVHGVAGGPQCEVACNHGGRPGFRCRDGLDEIVKH